MGGASELFDERPAGSTPASDEEIENGSLSFSGLPSRTPSLGRRFHLTLRKPVFGLFGALQTEGVPSRQESARSPMESRITA